jgi:hypothetical protein
MDPISSKVGAGGLSNISGELSKAPGIGGGSKFEAMRLDKAKGGDPIGGVERQMESFQKTGKLDGKAAAPSMAERVAARDGIAFQPNLQFARFDAGNNVQGGSNIWAPKPVGDVSASNQVAGAVQGLNQGQARLEQIIGELKSGKQYNQQELLGLQAEVNMLSEQVQMSTKLVDSAMQSIKSVMQQQV